MVNSMAYNFPMTNTGMLNMRVSDFALKRISRTRDVIAVTAAVCTVCTMSFVISVSVFLKGHLERVSDSWMIGVIETSVHILGRNVLLQSDNRR